jgi:chromatin remodeling complex protein RSC6
MAKKRTTKRKTTRKTTTKRKAKKPFGGYAISFKDRDESLEQVFGKTEITPSEMTKKIWKFIKSKKLSNK